MTLENHPYQFLKYLFKKDDAIFSFSKYIYVPDSLFDERQVMKVSASEINSDWLESELHSLGERQELAINSITMIKNRKYHIPMIDFMCKELSGTDMFDRMRYYLPHKIITNMAIYHSGTSYHAYSNTLITPKEWLDFMYRLLLVNRPHEDEIIDSRWIAHRLMGGYGSLRWSNNSSLYKGSPTRISYP